jgi:glycosyltransferase involved in cell wall biosynthesis
MKWFVLMLFLTIESFATVRILTFHYNQPSFVEIQSRALRKFLKDEFELIVFNDAKTEENELGIENACKGQGIRCVRFEPEWHLTDPLNRYIQARLQESSTIPIWGWNGSTSIEEIAKNPSVRHSHVIQYALDHYGYDHDDIVVIMDGDNFLLKPLSIRELLGSNDLVGFNQAKDALGTSRRQSQISVPQGEEMLWVVFIAFCPRKLPLPRELHFHVDLISGWPHLPENTIGDTGAAAYQYLKKYPHLKIAAYQWLDSWALRTYFSLRELKEMGLSNGLIRFIYQIFPGNVQFFLLEHFMHFAAVSVEDADHERKVRYLTQFMDELLQAKAIP